LDPVCLRTTENVTACVILTHLFVKYEMHVALLYLSSALIPVLRQNYRETIKPTIKQCYILEKNSLHSE